MTTQADMFHNVCGTLEPKRYPAIPGFKAEGTSKVAAESAHASAGTLRAAVMAQLRQANNLTADEIASRMGESVLSVRPRVAELNALSRIIDSGIRRKNESGRYAVAWRIA